MYHCTKKKSSGTIVPNVPSRSKSPLGTVPVLNGTLGTVPVHLPQVYYAFYPKSMTILPVETGSRRRIGAKVAERVGDIRRVRRAVPREGTALYGRQVSGGQTGSTV